MLQSSSSHKKRATASWQPKTPEDDPIKSFGKIIGLEVLAILIK